MVKLCQTVLITLALRLWYGIHVVPLKCKLATVKGKKADVSSVSPSSERSARSNRSDEGLTLETSAFLPFTVANLRFQPSC